MVLPGCNLLAAGIALADGARSAIGIAPGQAAGDELSLKPAQPRAATIMALHKSAQGVIRFIRLVACIFVMRSPISAITRSGRYEDVQNHESCWPRGKISVRHSARGNHSELSAIRAASARSGGRITIRGGVPSAGLATNNWLAFKRRLLARTSRMSTISPGRSERRFRSTLRRV